MLDPFDTLAVDALILQKLLSHHTLERHVSTNVLTWLQQRAQQAFEPLFSISDPYSFHNVHDAYRNGFADPAFVNAIVCAISFVQHREKLTPEVLFYQGEAIRNINIQLDNLMSLDCTVGYILLLVGVEVGCSMTSSNIHASLLFFSGALAPARLHGSILVGLIRYFKNLHPIMLKLSASTRRGIFWQDLNTAIVTNTARVLSRATFPEFQWGTAFKIHWAKLPVGFEDMRGVLGGPAVQILQDLYVLSRTRDGVGSYPNNVDAIHHMDNQQACVEARLHENSRLEWGGV
jgi:hypothetical protein